MLFQDRRYGRAPPVCRSEGDHAAQSQFVQRPDDSGGDGLVRRVAHEHIAGDRDPGLQHLDTR